MRSTHLSDLEIRQYILDTSNCDPEVPGHVETCATCQVEIKIFQLVLSGIRDQPAPAFDFDLSGLVLSQIAKSKKTKPLPAFLFYLMVVIFITVISLSCYFFRSYFLTVFSGLGEMGFYLLLTTACTILFFQVVEMHKNYQQQIKDLNFS